MLVFSLCPRSEPTIPLKMILTSQAIPRDTRNVIIIDLEMVRLKWITQRSGCFYSQVLSRAILFQMVQTCASNFLARANHSHTKPRIVVTIISPDLIPGDLLFNPWRRLEIISLWTNIIEFNEPSSSYFDLKPNYRRLLGNKKDLSNASKMWFIKWLDIYLVILLVIHMHFKCIRTSACFHRIADIFSSNNLWLFQSDGFSMN